ncbi:MAG: energy transducer TonB [Gammaproteobacteria bacterium]|nr:energy transducer TonB [Gammaproteobacteria bacterium]
MRYLLALGAGAVMALLLFLLMSTLISGAKGFEKDEGSGKVVEFIRIRQEDITNIKQRRKPKEPEPPKKPPPPPKLKVSRQDKPPPTPFRMETPNIDISLGAGGGPYLGAWNPGDIGSDGDVIPIVRINPQYPRDALMEGTEGFVEIEFTILEDGTVSDASVVNSQPRRIFNRAALRAIYRWKFKPRIIDGVPVQRRAKQTIEFNMEPLE